MVNFFTSLSCYSGINIFGIVNAFAETAVFSSPDASVKSVTFGHVTLADGANSEGIQKGSGSFTIDGNAVTDGNQASEGVFVVNGKVVIVKNGKQYTAADARIK